MELEIKLNLPPGSIAALNNHPALQSAAQTSHEITTYFDTPSRQLDHLGAILPTVRAIPEMTEIENRQIAILITRR